MIIRLCCEALFSSCFLLKSRIGSHVNQCHYQNFNRGKEICHYVCKHACELGLSSTSQACRRYESPAYESQALLAVLFLRSIKQASRQSYQGNSAADRKNALFVVWYGDWSRLSVGWEPEGKTMAGKSYKYLKIVEVLVWTGLSEIKMFIFIAYFFTRTTKRRKKDETAGSF